MKRMPEWNLSCQGKKRWCFKSYEERERTEEKPVLSEGAGFSVLRHRTSLSCVLDMFLCLH